ncbi:MAG: hypothetical protein NTZ67_01495 [Gammaproteobacteria bacterium]|nr:hypothetical protein [Gammaproteobacteria bacterium]
MKFLDKTRTPEVEVELSLAQVQALIKAETGRELVFEDLNLARTYNSLIKLIRFPNPIGFALAANQFIRARTKICCYGGVVTQNYNIQDDISYLNTAKGPDGEVYQFQAQNSGDLGALAIHLPDSDFLTTCDIDKDDYAAIQMSNVTEFLDPFDPQKNFPFLQAEIFKQVN